MLKRTLQRLVDVRDGEIRVLLWSCAYFFCVLTFNFILRPLRDEIGSGSGREELPWLFTFTFVGTLIANPIYAALVTHFPRRKFIPIAYHCCALALLAFYVLLRFLPEDGAGKVANVFFVWLSVVNMFLVSLFWSFMADIFSWQQSKRLFGFVAVGGSLGAIAGSGITSLLAKPIGPVHLFLVAILFLELAVVAVGALVKLCNVHDELAVDATAESDATLEGQERGGIFTGIQLAFRSPFLFGICLYLFFYTLSSTFFYFEQSSIIGEAVASKADRTALLARMDLAVNVISIGVQVFFTGRIIRALGVGFALFSQPLLAMIAFACLGWSPVLAVIVVAQVGLRAANFATAKPAREILYTVVGREAKYKSKSFIDTFIYRGGDALGGWAFDGLQQLKLSLSQIAFIGVPISAGWMLVGLLLGRKQEKLAIARGESEARADEQVAAVDVSAPLR
jgi:AAA family ATP:ADP antiporter